jgi:hypothetical protein
MKAIELKSFKELHDGREIDVTTIEMVRAAVKNAPPGGFTVDDIISRMRILDALSKLNGKTTLELEDSDFANLGRYVKETRWNILSERIVEFSKLFQ